MISYAIDVSIIVCPKILCTRLRDPTLSTDSFGRLLNTRLFSEY